jgi:hypothetical protein
MVLITNCAKKTRYHLSNRPIGHSHSRAIERPLGHRSLKKKIRSTLHVPSCCETTLEDKTCPLFEPHLVPPPTFTPPNQSPIELSLRPPQNQYVLRCCQRPAAARTWAPGSGQESITCCSNSRRPTRNRGRGSRSCSRKAELQCITARYQTAQRTGAKYGCTT